jgi:hypothetical protein
MPLWVPLVLEMSGPILADIKPYVTYQKWVGSKESANCVEINSRTDKNRSLEKR